MESHRAVLIMIIVCCSEIPKHQGRASRVGSAGYTHAMVDTLQLYLTAT